MLEASDPLASHEHELIVCHWYRPEVIIRLSLKLRVHFATAIVKLSWICYTGKSTDAEETWVGGLLDLGVSICELHAMFGCLLNNGIV